MKSQKKCLRNQLCLFTFVKKYKIIENEIKEKDSSSFFQNSDKDLEKSKHEFFNNNAIFNADRFEVRFPLKKKQYRVIT